LKGKRVALIMLFVVALLIVSVGLWLRARQRQYALNRQLIAALVNYDDKQALALVNAGADPNTRFEPTPVPSLLQLVRQLLRRSPPPVNDSETALSIACGEVQHAEDATNDAQIQRPDNAPLVQAMLIHGATVNVADGDGNTPLMWAALSNRLNSMRLLLDHEAEVNAKAKDGTTTLEYAAMLRGNSDMVRLLLKNGANANMQDKDGKTALNWAA
jgi:hypothetical protein